MSYALYIDPYRMRVGDSSDFERIKGALDKAAFRAASGYNEERLGVMHQYLCPGNALVIAFEEVRPRAQGSLWLISDSRLRSPLLERAGSLLIHNRCRPLKSGMVERPLARPGDAVERTLDRLRYAFIRETGFELIPEGSPLRPRALRAG